jgi:hypothetical protein
MQVRILPLRKISEDILLSDSFMAEYFRVLLVQLFTVWAIHLAFSL